MQPNEAYHCCNTAMKPLIAAMQLNEAYQCRNAAAL